MRSLPRQPTPLAPRRETHSNSSAIPRAHDVGDLIAGVPARDVSRWDAWFVRGVAHGHRTGATGGSFGARHPDAVALARRSVLAASTGVTALRRVERLFRGLAVAGLAA